MCSFDFQVIGERAVTLEGERFTDERLGRGEGPEVVEEHRHVIVDTPFEVRGSIGRRAERREGLSQIRVTAKTGSTSFDDLVQIGRRRRRGAAGLPCLCRRGAGASRR